MPIRRRNLVPNLIGAIEALVLARLVLRLFAARPDNPVFQGLFTATGVLAAPFTILDTYQPRFGAVLEFSTLALALVLPLAILGFARFTRASSH